jgi:XTP/dITP diphosphohydrolase
VRAVLATGNAGKARELGRLLPALALEPLDVDVPEHGETFAENALTKARAAHAAAPDAIGLGDDSGLEVEALDGDPGIRSARWTGPDDAARNRALLGRMQGVEDRHAAFVCALAAVLPDGRELVVEGRLEGSIAAAPAGDSGFGYDPLFVPEGEQRTLAELGPARKDELSHRARAAAGLREALDELDLD